MPLEFVDLDADEKDSLERFAVGSDFFTALLEGHKKYGHLTKKQHACLTREIDKRNAP